MYWFNIKPFIVGWAFFLLTSCGTPTAETVSTNRYFDLKKYFTEEASRISKRNLLIKKSVSRNGETETKTVSVINWPAELALFIESDINKPSWQRSYRKEISKNFIIYAALDKSLRTRKIVIKQENKQIRWILIENYTRNELYSTVEKLSYFPGSHYEIKKSQSIRLLGNNRYLITGYFEMKKAAI
ncbi:MAG: hypothetical protein ACOH2A_07255 [Sphingobacteriaceae bacterium]